jgi:hypothetical protein
MSDSAMERTFEWYLSGTQTTFTTGRLDCTCNDKMAEDDLTGRLIRSENEPKADKWEKISFPALLGDEEDPVPVCLNIGT